MAHLTGALPQYIPSPPASSFHIGPLDVRFYALGYIIGITLAVLITRRRWRAMGGDTRRGFQWLVQTNLPKLDKPTLPQHPTPEQAGGEHDRETGTNRIRKNDLE